MLIRIDTRSISTYCVILLFFNFGIIRDCQSHNILVPYAWREVDFLYPSEIERNEAIANGSYVPAVVLVNDVDAWPGEYQIDLYFHRFDTVFQKQTNKNI